MGQRNSRCEILLTTKDGPIVAGTVELRGRDILLHPEKGYEHLLQNVLEETHTINREEVSAKDNSRAWFKTLPQHYSGHRMMARII